MKVNEMNEGSRDANLTIPSAPGRSFTWFKRGLIGLAGGLLALGGLGAVYQAYATRRDERRYPAPGQLVDAGGFRLHLNVSGQEHGGPVVILDAGLGLPSIYMTRLQSAIALFAQVVAYDRPGLGWSEPPPDGQPHDALGNARALHKALANAGIPGPYVLVGHSAGGINMIVFAATYPDETGGLVLLDSTHPDQFTRYPPEQAQGQKRVAQLVTLADVASRLGLLRLVNGPHFLEADDLEPDQRAALQAYFASPRLAAGMKAEMAAWEDLTFPQARAVKDLDAKPLVVLTAGDTAAQVPVQIDLHRELAALSTNSLHHVLEGASHARLVSHPDYLPEVTAAIRQVVDAVQTGTPLDGQ
jgi:pimeloyl-ACP methyl ester carboxylesterase